MKKLSILLIALILLSFNSQETNILKEQNNAIALSVNDKEFLLMYFQEVMQNLEKNVEGLSEEQLQFKASAEEWSVSQILEHILLTEGMLFETTKELLAAPANPERKNEVKITDEEIIAGMTDRSFKAKAPKELQPEGKYLSSEVAIQDVKKQRAEILAFIDNIAVEDLRNHISDSPFGPVDAYHSLLYIAGHMERHTAQIEEVKANAGFPSE